MENENIRMSCWGVCEKCGPHHPSASQLVIFQETTGWKFVFNVRCSCGEEWRYEHERMTAGELQGSVDWGRVFKGLTLNIPVTV